MKELNAGTLYGTSGFTLEEICAQGPSLLFGYDGEVVNTTTHAISRYDIEDFAAFCIMVDARGARGTSRRNITTVALDDVTHAVRGLLEELEFGSRVPVNTRVESDLIAAQLLGKPNVEAAKDGICRWRQGCGFWHAFSLGDAANRDECVQMLGEKYGFSIRVSENRKGWSHYDEDNEYGSEYEDRTEAIRRAVLVCSERSDA